MSISSINFLSLNQSLQNIKTGRLIAQTRSNQAASKEPSQDVLLMIEPEKTGKQNTLVDLNVARQSSFNLQMDYQDNQVQLHSANGFYSFEQQRLDLTMGFEFSLRSEINGQIVENRFKLNLSISIENTRISQGAVKLQKEDINLYILRIVKTLGDYAKEKDINIAALFLDDMEELATIKDGKLLEQIFALVSAMFWTKKLLNSDAENSLLYIPRKKQNVPEINQEQVSKININFSIQEQFSLTKSSGGSKQALETETTNQTESGTELKEPV